MIASIITCMNVHVVLVLLFPNKAFLAYGALVRKGRVVRVFLQHVLLEIDMRHSHPTL